MEERVREARKETRRPEKRTAWGVEPGAGQAGARRVRPNRDGVSRIATFFCQKKSTMTNEIALLCGMM